MPMKTMLVSRRSPRTAGPFAEVVAGDLHLGDDLGGGEVAHQRLGAGVAEGAVERAAHLAGDAQGAGASDVGNEYRLGLDAGREADQPFDRAVEALLALDHLRPGQDEAIGQRGARLLGDVGHGREVGDAGMVDPAPDLSRTHAGIGRRGGAGADQRIFQLGAGQTRQVHRLVGPIGN